MANQRVRIPLPFAQARFCGAEGIDQVKVGSAFRSSFGEDYGVTMTDGPMAGLLARSVVVVDADGTVLHSELVPEITQEPDYDAAVAALGWLQGTLFGNVATAVAVIAVVAAIPYFALQFKAVGMSVGVLSGKPLGAEWYSDPALYIALMLAVFAARGWAAGFVGILAILAAATLGPADRTLHLVSGDDVP